MRGVGFWAPMEAQGASICGFLGIEKNRFVKMGAFIHDFRPTQPDFNHQEPGDKKCGCAGSVLGCFQALIGASGAPDV